MPDKGIKDIYLEKGVGKKTGKEYFSLVIDFECGYKYTTFISNEQKFILEQIVPTK